MAFEEEIRDSMKKKIEELEKMKAKMRTMKGIFTEKEIDRLVILEWKNVHVKNYEEDYQVSNYAEVRSLKTKKRKTLNQHNRCKYKAVYLENNKLDVSKTINVHQLVAHSFVSGYKPGYVINHKDGNKFNNESTNLEFISHSDNAKHAYATGLKKPSGTREVVQYDSKGHFVKTYSSIAEASRETKIISTKISDICKGKQKMDNNKCIWKYAKNKIMVEVDLSDISYIRKIKGFEHYYVTIDGKIYSTFTKNFMSLKDDGSGNGKGIKGYQLIAFHNNGIQSDQLVHRIVAEYFIDNPDNKPLVNHLNKDRSDNRVENLEWVTASENMIHSVRS
jgi:hypothetical protein